MDQSTNRAVSFPSNENTAPAKYLISVPPAIQVRHSIRIKEQIILAKLATPWRSYRSTDDIDKTHKHQLTLGVLDGPWIIICMTFG